MGHLRAIFGGALAVVLLIFYVYAVWYACLAAACVGGSTGCTGYSPQLPAGVGVILTVVGGLLSALAIAELAVSDPGSIPTGRLVTGPLPALGGAMAIITAVYLTVWMICGVAMVIVGLLRFPDAVPVLTEAAKGWLGLAVGAAYAYFGLKAGRER
jgi:hypothetical protein